MRFPICFVFQKKCDISYTGSTQYTGADLDQSSCYVISWCCITSSLTGMRMRCIDVTRLIHVQRLSHIHASFCSFPVLTKVSSVKKMPGYAVVVPSGIIARLLCPECKLLLREPVQTTEGIRLCKTCYDAIARWRSNSNLAPWLYFIIFYTSNRLPGYTSPQSGISVQAEDGNVSYLSLGQPSLVGQPLLLRGRSFKRSGK